MIRSGEPDHGSAVVEFIWLTLLLLMPLVYLMSAVLQVQRASYGVAAASRSAARAFVQSPDFQTAEYRAKMAARLALGDQGVAGEVNLRCLPSADDCLAPDSAVRVEITVVQPPPLISAIFGEQLGGVRVTGSHTQPFGRFRQTR